MSRRKQKAVLYVSVTFDPKATDSEGLASAMDILLKTATSTPGILDEYGNPSMGEFLAMPSAVVEEAIANLEGLVDGKRDELAEALAPALAVLYRIRTNQE